MVGPEARKLAEREAGPRRRDTRRAGGALTGTAALKVRRAGGAQANRAGQYCAAFGPAPAAFRQRGSIESASCSVARSPAGRLKAPPSLVARALLPARPPWRLKAPPSLLALRLRGA